MLAGVLCLVGLVRIVALLLNGIVNRTVNRRRVDRRDGGLVTLLLLVVVVVALVVDVVVVRLVDVVLVVVVLLLVCRLVGGLGGRVGGGASTTVAEPLQRPLMQTPLWQMGCPSKPVQLPPATMRDRQRAALEKTWRKEDGPPTERMTVITRR